MSLSQALADARQRLSLYASQHERMARLYPKEMALAQNQKLDYLPPEKAYWTQYIQEVQEDYPDEKQERQNELAELLASAAAISFQISETMRFVNLERR